jgi:hypothetical protein
MAMHRSRFAPQQIIVVPRQQAPGATTPDLRRREGLRTATLQ